MRTACRLYRTLKGVNMQTSHRWVSAVAGIALSLIPVAQAIASEKSGRLSGSVMNVSNDKSEITIRYGTAGRVVE
jgi:hypothetical protein